MARQFQHLSAPATPGRCSDLQMKPPAIARLVAPCRGRSRIPGFAIDPVGLGATAILGGAALGYPLDVGLGGRSASLEFDTAASAVAGNSRTIAWLELWVLIGVLLNASPTSSQKLRSRSPTAHNAS